MKPITLLSLIAGLNLVVSLSSLAQDATTRPLQEQPIIQTEEAPSPTAAASPAAKTLEESSTEPEVMPTPIPQPSPTRTREMLTAKPKKKSAVKPEPPPAETPEKPAIKPTEEPAATTEKPAVKSTEKPAAKPERTSVETTERNFNKRAEAATLKELEREWEASFSDPAVIEKAVADDFVGTSRDGKIISKRSLLREARRNTRPAPETVAHDLDVHFYGPNIAVVVGGAKQTDKNRAGQKVMHNFRFTDTWVKRAGQWQCVASQSILVP